MLTQPNMKIPSRGKPIYSVNEANRWGGSRYLDESKNNLQFSFKITHTDESPAPPHPTVSSDWEPELRDYVTAVQKGEGETGKQYTARYLGSMVGDIHRTLLYGGIFGYPADSKNVNGKLRLLYEAAPIAFLVEAAGGMALSNADRILDIDPTNVHQVCACRPPRTCIR